MDVTTRNGILRNKELEWGGLRSLFANSDLLGKFTGGDSWTSKLADKHTALGLAASRAAVSARYNFAQRVHRGIM